MIFLALLIAFGMCEMIHLIYPLILAILPRLRNPSVYGKNTLPLVSVIIPTYREEAVIARRLDNLFDTTYPEDKMEVIVVNSGEDRTSSIIVSKYSKQVRLIEESKRSGKAHAINQALPHCKGEIVILTDGPALYENETISKIVASFSDSSVGGVSALYKIPNDMENQITMNEALFWSHKDKVRVLEGKVWSTSWLSGEACAFRRKLIDKIPEDTLADDSNIALQIISKGYRVIINEEAFFFEKSPAQIRDYFRVKARRALGGLKEVFRFRELLFNPKYRYFGSIIFPYRFFTQVLSPIVSLTALALIIPAIFDIFFYAGLWAAIALAVLLITFLILFRKKIAVYIQLQLIMLAALILLVLGRTDVRWAQAKTRH